MHLAEKFEFRNFDIDTVRLSIYFTTTPSFISHVWGLITVIKAFLYLGRYNFLNFLLSGIASLRHL